MVVGGKLQNFLQRSSNRTGTQTSKRFAEQRVQVPRRLATQGQEKMSGLNAQKVCQPSKTTRSLKTLKAHGIISITYW